MVSKLDEHLLDGLAPFAGLAPEQIREVLDLGVMHRWQEGDVIFRSGDRADWFYLLLDGAVRPVRITANGEQVVPLHIPAGQLFGVASAIGRDTYPATATAATDCVTIAWPSRYWSDFTARFNGFAHEAYREIGDRLQELQQRITELSTEAVEQRVAAALLRLVNQSGRKVADGIEIAFPITRATIAEMTGTTLHTVSRLLSAWERDGVVASTRKHVTITDPHRLVLISRASS